VRGFAIFQMSLNASSMEPRTLTTDQNSRATPIPATIPPLVFASIESENSNTFIRMSDWSENFTRSSACSLLSKPKPLAMPKTTATTGTTDSRE